MKISALICTFGTAKWEHLARTRALPSVDGQGFHEVIVLHLPDATLAQVRNAAAEQATGDHLCFIDGDDLLQPGFHGQVQRAGGGKDGAHLFTPSVQYVRGEGSGQRRGERTWPAKIWPEIDIHDGNWMIIGTVVPRDLFLEVGGFREYAWSEDWAVWAMCMEAGAVPVKVPEAVYVAHVNHKSRNRSRVRAEVLYWHMRIGHDLWPDLYEQPTELEDERQALGTNHVRRLDGK